MKGGWRRLKQDRMAMVSLTVVVFYSMIAILAKAKLIAAGWDAKAGGYFQPPSLESLPMIFGTDFLGRSVFYKTIQGTRIAMSVGLVTAVISTVVGGVLGAVAGYFGGWIDELVVWLYTTLSSIPSIMLLVAIVFMLGKGMSAIYIALGVTAWVGLCRVIRGEFLKHKNAEYVIAAQSLGASHFSRIFRHILPNVTHFVIINLAIQFMSAIKAEVILSFLGLGAQGQPSWGMMIDDAKLELQRANCVWWQLAAATIAMFFIVLAFNILSDSLRDALDPKVNSG